MQNGRKNFQNLLFYFCLLMHSWFISVSEIFERNEHHKLYGIGADFKLWFCSEIKNRFLLRQEQNFITSWKPHWNTKRTGISKLREIFCITKVWKDNCALLGYYAASSGNFLPTFRDNLSVQSSWSLKIGMKSCSETSVRN